MVCQLTAGFPGRGTDSVLLVRAACITLPRPPKAMAGEWRAMISRAQYNLLTSLAMLEYDPSTTGADRKSSAKNRIVLRSTASLSRAS